MKRGAGLVRRVGLVARKPWRPVRKPLPAKSAKRLVVERERWRVKAEYLAEHQFCEMAGGTCVGRPLDVHERLSRARGGSITDPANFVALCRPCHDHVTRNPAWAEAHGWSLKTGVANDG